MKTFLSSALLGATLLLVPLATAQTVRDVNHDVLPTSAEPMIDSSWQQMHLTVNHHHVDNTLSFAPDGRLRVQFAHSKRGVDGHWSVQPGKLCMQLPVRGTECFDYTHMIQKGETVAISSNRGWTGKVTMLTDATGTSLGQALPAIAAQ